LTAASLSTRAIARVFFTLAALAALLYVLYLVRSTLLLVFIAAFLAVALGPAVDAFNRRGVPRGLSVLLVYVLIGLAIVGVGLLVVPPVVTQVKALSEDIPNYVTDLRTNETFRRYDDRYDISQKLTAQARTLPSRLGDAAGALQAVTVGVFGAIVKLVTVLTMTFFMLLDGRRIVDFLMRSRGEAKEARYREVFEDIYRSTAGYVAGNLLISIIAGTSAYVTMLVLGVPFAVPLAVLFAFLDLIPLVGATIGGVTIALVTAFNDFPTDTIIWLIVFILYQQVENNVLQPVVYRRTVNVAPLLVIVAILIGSSLLGVLGALVAIPVAAAIQIVVKDVFELEASDAPVAAEPPAGTA
jgi:predicted PurR-regulated permease PerM